LKSNVFRADGGAGNSGVSGIIIGDKGVIMVDAKTYPADGKELLGAVAKLAPKRVSTVILTHSDIDHVGGLASFPAGITIIAHEGNKKELEAALARGGRGALPADHLPTQVVTKNQESFKIDGVKLELLHWAPAHTSGDLVVYLPSEKIVFMGDLINDEPSRLPEPLIHLPRGSSEGWITTVNGILALNADQFVPGHVEPGHGRVLTKADIQKRLDEAVARRAKIKELVAQGKSLEEIKIAVGDKEPARYALDGFTPARPGARFQTFPEIVYRELTNKP
jgi:glyoxylase-like metal-dependent hydrolase (beta-lactamase superfamily II)